MGKKHTMTGGFHTETDCWCWKATEPSKVGMLKRIVGQLPIIPATLDTVDRQYIKKRVRVWFGEPVIAVENEIEQLLLSKAIDSRIDEIKQFQRVMRGGKLSVVASIFDREIAELIKLKEKI